MQESFELVGGLINLLTWRAPPPVGQLARLADPIPVLVVPDGPPAISVAADHRVQGLAFDGEQPPRAEEQVIDLATAVAVAAQQCPLIPQSTAQPGLGHLLAVHSGGQDTFP